MPYQIEIVQNRDNGPAFLVPPDNLFEQQGCRPRIDRREQVAAIRERLPTLRAVVHVPYGGGPDDALPDAHSWTELLAEPAPLEFASLPFAHPLYVLFSPERLTLPAGLKLLQGAYTTDYPVILTGATVASVPVLILYIFVQRYVIEGVARSGIKG